RSSIEKILRPDVEDGSGHSSCVREEFSARKRSDRDAAFHGVRPDGRGDRHAAAGAVRGDGRLRRRAGRQGRLPRWGGLYGTEDAINFVVRDGQVTRVDGPYAEAKEVVGGWSLLQYDTVEEAAAAQREFAE